MNVILQANKEEAEAERKMCEALRELFAEDLKEFQTRGLKQGLEQGLEQGLAQGLAQGREQGREQGEALGIELAKKVFRLEKQNLTEDEIAKACDISVEKVRHILE